MVVDGLDVFEGVDVLEDGESGIVSYLGSVADTSGLGATDFDSEGKPYGVSGDICGKVEGDVLGGCVGYSDLSVETISIEDDGAISGLDTSIGKVERLCEANIVPKVGNFLGLDISQNSAGICFISNGDKTTGNIDLSEDQLSIRKSDKSCYEEVLLRRALKRDLSELVTGVDFDTIVIEDAFTGENPKVSRLLYALNTAIDELILDGVCSCKNFLRVQNTVWKSWLWNSVDPAKKYKGIMDKLRIAYCLRDIGVDEGTRAGFQDRLDATGMLYGYFLVKDDQEILNKKNLVTWSRVDLAYELDESFIFEDNPWLSDLDVVHVDINRFTKSEILSIINKDPSKLYISNNIVYTGIQGMKLGLNTISDGGYLAFWLKKSVRGKLLS